MRWTRHFPVSHSTLQCEPRTPESKPGNLHYFSFLGKLLAMSSAWMQTHLPSSFHPALIWTRLFAPQTCTYWANTVRREGSRGQKYQGETSYLPSNCITWGRRRPCWGVKEKPHKRNCNNPLRTLSVLWFRSHDQCLFGLLGSNLVLYIIAISSAKVTWIRLRLYNFIQNLARPALETVFGGHLKQVWAFECFRKKWEAVR